MGRLDPFTLFVLVLALTGVMRLVELAVSVYRVRSRPAAVVAEPLLFPVMTLLHVGLIVAPPVEVLWLDRAFSPTLAWIAGTVLLLATALRIWTLRTIGRAWNVRVVAPEKIVTCGPYAWIRHPNYLAVILEVASLPLLHAAWLSSLALSMLNGFVLYCRISTEEAELSKVEAWRSAMSRRARLVPGLF